MNPKQKFSRYVLALTGVVFSSFLVFTGSPAHADTNTQIYRANVNTSLNVYLSTYNTIDIEVNPSAKPFSKSEFYISVSTNNDTGYYMNMGADSTDLVNTNNHTILMPTLSPLDGGYTESTFETNRWGYKVGDGNYVPFTAETNIASSDGPVNEDRVDLTYATKVDFMQTPGIYENTVNFAIVANPTPLVIQDLDPAFCTETPTVAIDARDGEEYLIQRLADGKCWMLDNLRFDPSESTSIAIKDKTNAPNEALGYLKNGGSTVPKYPVNGLNANENTYTSPYMVTQYKDMVLEDTPGVGSKKVGILYNYCALSAGTYCYDYDIDGGNSAYNLCPAGWRLPSGHGETSGSGDFATLWHALSDENDSYDRKNELFTTALSLPAAGRGYNTPDGSSGDYWTSDYSGNDQMWVMQIGYNDGKGWVGFNEDKYRDDTRSVRCLMEERTLGDITYMQETTPRIVANTADGATATLKDYRDNQDYTVAKGTRTYYSYNGYQSVQVTENVAMMTRNLAIGCNGTGDTYGSAATSKVLDYATSNVENKWNTPTTSFAVDENAHLLCNSERGAYYNYYAATSETTATTKYSNIDVPDPKINICPRGWRIPGDEGSWFARTYSETFTPLLDGYYSAGKWGFDPSATRYTEQGYTGWWWSDWLTGPYLWYDSNNDNWDNSWYGVNYYLWSADTQASGMYLRCSFLGTREEH